MPQIALPKFLVSIMTLLFLSITSLNAISIDTLNKMKKDKQTQYNEIIQEEIKELIDDYSNFEEGYAEQWVEGNMNDLEIDEDFTKDDLDNMRYESIDGYAENRAYSGLNISNSTLDYMKKQVYNKLGLQDYESEIIKRYLIKVLIEEVEE